MNTDKRLPIVYDDPGLMVVNKPAGLLSHSSVDRSRPNLEQLVNEQFDTGKRWVLLHRLDCQTSGALLVACEAQLIKDLQQQFCQHAIRKIYLAVVTPRPTIPDGAWIRTRLSRRPDKQGRYHVVTHGGLLAISWATLLLDLGDIALVQMVPLSGRTHQIRIQLAHLGSPILGDALYGVAPPNSRAKRLMLHAYSIRFNHPRRGGEVTATAPVWEDMLSVIGGSDYKVVQPPEIGSQKTPFNFGK